MRILMVHNHYQSTSPSGETVVFDAEVDMLRRRNHHILTFEAHNDEIINYDLQQKIRLAVRACWSATTYRRLRRTIRRFKPHIVHFHNITPLLSPSAYYACLAEGVPVVQTLHNYRLLCLNGLLFRDGSVCERCVNRTVLRGVLYGCYRNSQLQSAVMAASVMLHRLLKTSLRAVDAFIALTEFAKSRFVAAGLPEEKLFVKPNFLPADIPANNSVPRKPRALYIGRLSCEKGIKALLKAWHGKDMPELVIVGAGPLQPMVEKAARENGKIAYRGRLPRTRCVELLTSSLFCVVASVWYEAFPLSVVEAFAAGTAVVASRIGSLAELIKDGYNGLLFEPGNAEDLRRCVLKLYSNPELAIEMGRNARKEFMQKYTEDENYRTLMRVYEIVLKRRRLRA